LKALAYDHGVQVVEDELRTAGKATRIALTGDRATASTGDDVVTIIATAVDEKGIQVPDASDEVQFTVTGPGEIVATDNGSILDHDSFSLPRHHLYSGRAIAFVRATASSGAIRVLASAPGLAGGDLNLKAAPAAPSQFARSF